MSTKRDKNEPKRRGISLGNVRMETNPVRNT